MPLTNKLPSLYEEKLISARIAAKKAEEEKKKKAAALAQNNRASAALPVLLTLPKTTSPISGSVISNRVKPLTLPMAYTPPAQRLKNSVVKKLELPYIQNNSAQTKANEPKKLTLPYLKPTQRITDSVTKKREIPALSLKTREQSTLPVVGTPASMATEGKMQTTPTIGGNKTSSSNKIGSDIDYLIKEAGRGILDVVENAGNFIGGSIVGVGNAITTPFPKINRIEDISSKLKEYAENSKNRFDKGMADHIESSPLTYNINTREQASEDAYDKTDKNKLIKVGGDISYNIGYMVPSLLASAGTGEAVALGKLLSTGIISASSYSTGLKQAYAEGASARDASNYALLSAFVEGVGDQLIGGAGGIGSGIIDTATKGALSKLANKITNPALRAAGSYMLKNVIGEGVEEGIQELGDIVAKRATYAPNAPVDWSQVGYAAALGGTIGGLFGVSEIPEHYSNAQISAAGAEINKSPDDVQTVINEAIGDRYKLTLPGGTPEAAKKLATELDAKLKTGGIVSDSEIGTLYYMVMANKARSGADRAASETYDNAKIKKDAEFKVRPDESGTTLDSSTPREGAAPASDNSITQNVGAVNTLYGNGNKTVTDRRLTLPYIDNTKKQFSIMKTADNVPYVKIDRDILAGVPQSQWIKTVTNNLKNKFVEAIDANGQLIKINKQSRSEMTRSKSSALYQDYKPDIFTDKMRSTDNADDLLRASQNYINEAPKHPRKDEIVDFARGSVNMEVGKNKYQASIVTGTLNDGNVILYDVVNIKPVTEFTTKKRMQSLTFVPEKSGDSLDPSTPRVSTVPASDNSITQNSGAVNTLYGNGNIIETNKTGGNGVNGTSVVADTAAQYSIKKTADNVPYVKVDRDILAGVPKSEWIKTVTNNLKNKFIDAIDANGQPIKISTQSRGELTYSKSSNYYKIHEPVIYADKFRFTDNADDILRVSNNYISETLKHPRKDNIINFARGSVNIESGTNKYKASVVIGILKNGSAILYDVKDINPVLNFSIKKDAEFKTRPDFSDTFLVSSKSRVGATPASSNSITQNGNAVNTLYGNGNKTVTNKNGINDNSRLISANGRIVAPGGTIAGVSGRLAGASEADIAAVERVSSKLKREVEFYRSDSSENGFYHNGRIYINAASDNPVLATFAHELTHSLEGVEAYIGLHDYVTGKLGDGLADARAEVVQRYAQHGVTLNSDTAADTELVADYLQQHLLTDEDAISSLVKTDRSLGQKIKNWLDNIVTKLKGTPEQHEMQRVRDMYTKALGQSATRSDTVAMSFSDYDYTKPFEEQLKDYSAGKIPATDTLTVGETPEVFRRIGFNALPVTINQTHVDYALNGTKDIDHKLGADLLKQLPEKIKEPLAIITSETHPNTSVVALLPITYNGETVIAPVRVDGFGKNNDIIIDSNSITSLYGKRNVINLLNKAFYRETHGKTGIFYINKKAAARFFNEPGSQWLGWLIPHADGSDAATTFLQRSGLQLPGWLMSHADGSDAAAALLQQTGLQLPGMLISHADGYIHSIRESGSPVNPKLENVTYAQQFKRWFGDWENHANTASKVVDADGKPLVVYHGTNNNFDTFESNNGTYWFSQDRDYAEAMAKERKGNTIYSVYLNIRNPYRVKLEPGKFSDPNYEAAIIHKAKENGNDGVIIDTDTNDELVKDTYYVAFKPNQIKSIDNRGDFNKNNSNIRYSISTDAKLETADELHGKAKDAADRAARTLARSLGQSLSVKYGDMQGFLVPAAQRLAAEYMSTGKLSQESIDNVFIDAYGRGRMNNEEYIDNNRELRAYLFGTSLTLSPKDRADVGDYEAFRKRNFGVLRLKNEGGRSVDSFYTEISEMYPGIFPDNITSPADQLDLIARTAQSLKRAETDLDTYYGSEAKTFEEGTRRSFEEAINDFLPELDHVKQYVDAMDDKAAKNDMIVKVGEMSLDTDTPSADKIEMLKQAYDNVKTQRHEVDKVMQKTILTPADNAEVERLLAGYIKPDDLPANANRAAILSVYNAKKKLELAEAPIKMYNAGRKAALAKQADDNIGDIMRWKDKAAGMLYSRETFERNIRDIAPDKATADRMIETYRTPIAKNERAANVYKNELRNRVRNLKISEKVLSGNIDSESAAVQFIGEHDSMIEYLTKARKTADDHGKSVDDYQSELNDFIEQNPKFDYEAIRKKAVVMRGIYEDLFKRLNESRILNGYKPIDYRKGYFPHFIDETTKKDNDILKMIAQQFGFETNGDTLPTTINGLTQDFKPGIKWMGSSLERKGVKTTYDALAGFDRYIEPAADVIFHTGDLQKLRTLSQEIRLSTSDEGIKKQAETIRTREFASPEDEKNGHIETEEEKHEAILKLVKDGKYQLSNFVTDLDEYTNILAGKKSRRDRIMESDMGRKFYKVMKSVESRVAANMVAVNPGSWLTNFIPLHQASALIKPKYMISGMFDTLKAFKEGDNIESDSSFLVNRRGSDPLVLSRSAKVSQTLSMPMTYIDAFTSGTIVRARYAQNVASGMDTETALTEADGFASSVMAGRAKGDMPTLFAARNSLTKLFTQFQLEANNEFSYMFKDIPRELKEKKIRAVAAALLKYAVGAYLFNDWYEELTGRRAAFDPLGIINNTVGDFTGYKLPNIADTVVNSVKTLTLPTTDVFKTQKVGSAQALTNLGENVAKNIPFVGGLLGGGRLPIQAALPDVGKIVTAGANYADKKLTLPKATETIGKELIKPAAYLLPPFGGGQALKTAQGVAAVANNGVYTKDNTGNDQLQYPVSSGSGLNAIRNYAKGALFGKSSFSGAQNWVNSGFGSETVKFTDAYKKLVSAGYDADEAYAALGKVSNAKRVADKISVLSSLKIEKKDKTAVYRELIASDKEASMIDKLLADGENSRSLYSLLTKLRTAKNVAQIYFAIYDSSVSENAKIAAFENTVSKSTVEKFNTAQKYGVTIKSWVDIYIKLNASGTGDVYSQAKVKSVLDRMFITDVQKAALWQLMNKSWNAESNPYSVQIGAAVVTAMNGGTLLSTGSGKTVLPK